MSRTEKLLLVTGTNGGLGSALVENFLREGHRNIACHFRSSSDIIRKILAKYDLNSDKHLFRADLCVPEEVKRLRSEIEDKLGPVKHLLNLAGGSTNALSWKMTLDDFLNVIHMNLTSTFLTCSEFIPSMRQSGYGRIINTSSVVATSGVTGASHYCAAKSGIIGFSKALALELANKNICVNVLALGYFNTGLIHDVPIHLQEQIQSNIPLKRFGSPTEIYGIIKYLLGEQGSYMTSQVLHINGGLL